MDLNSVSVVEEQEEEEEEREGEHNREGRAFHSGQI
jgi:hypothetical protein